MENSITHQSGGTAAQTPNINPNQETIEPCIGTAPGGSTAPPNINPITEIMETSISTPPGGISAQAPDPNPNTKTMENHEPNETPVMVKEAAAAYQCAASSLKNNIKAAKLGATKAGPTAPFMVRLPDVERFLRATPGISSVFHPGNSPAEDPKQPGATTQSAAATTSVVPHQAQPKVGPVQQPIAPAATRPDADGGPETRATKKRRHRRRGKGGGSGLSHPLAAVRPPFLKALDGTTPAERLRMVACLNELAGLVASA